MHTLYLPKTLPCGITLGLLLSFSVIDVKACQFTFRGLLGFFFFIQEILFPLHFCLWQCLF